MAKDFDKLTPSEKNEVITGTKSVKRAPYDPANPHTRFNADNEVTNALYLKTMQDPKTRDAYRKELETYDKSKASKPVSSDIADKLQDMKNQKGAADYEKNKTYKKGGTASSRADGCATKGKTKGRMV